MNSRPRFLCDRMLGRLARWLRISGYDTLYPPEMDDDDLAGLAKERVLLTRDRLLARRVENSLLLKGTILDEQILCVEEFTGETLRPRMNRCTACNGQLRKIPKKNLNGGVPLGVMARQDEFHMCEECEKIYWKGSHWDRMNAYLTEIHCERPGNSPSR